MKNKMQQVLPQQDREAGQIWELEAVEKRKVRREAGASPLCLLREGVAIVGTPVLDEL
jgi:hypothetical protein